jgi:hypothetical protein
VISRSSNGTSARPVSIEISKPFVSYVVQEQMRTDDADVFAFLLAFEIEDTKRWAADYDVFALPSKLRQILSN